MAKGQTQQATAMSSGLAGSSTAQTQAGLFGGGAFGGGLTPQYTKQSGWQGQSREAAMQGAQQMAKTGGYDPTTLATISDFEKTGGFSDADKSRYLRQATGGIANTGKVLQQQEKQQMAATGGLGGADATAKMARNLEQTQATTTTKALDDLHTQIDQNKMMGVQAGAGVAAGIRSGNQMLQSMYNADTGALSDTGKQVLAMLGIDSSNQIASMNAMVQLSQNPGLLDNILKIAQTGISGASLFAG